MRKLFALLISSLLICAGVSAAPTDAHELVATDQSSKISLLQGWQPVSDLKEGAEFQAKSDLGFLIGLVDNKEDLVDSKLESFAKGRQEHILSSIVAGQVSDVKNFSVNKMRATSAVIKGAVGNLRISYLLTCIEGKDYLYQLLGWSTNSKFEQVRPQIEGMAQSFKELEKK